VSTTYARDFEAQSRQVGAKAPWLAELRRMAQQHFERTGFPTARDEDWRFLDLTPVTGREFPLAPADVSGVSPDLVAPWRFAIPGVSTLVFINGRFAPALSSLTETPDGVTVRNLAGALAAGGEVIERHLGRYAESSAGGFTALNTALLKDGLFVHVAKGAEAMPSTSRIRGPRERRPTRGVWWCWSRARARRYWRASSGCAREPTSPTP
jgi:Fe-S cluster assembly protein SufD